MSTRRLARLLLALAFLACPPAQGAASPSSTDKAEEKPAVAPQDDEATVRALQEAAAAVVSVRTRAIGDARSVESLGAQRAGSGVLIAPSGLVLTIGYLILEADQVEVTDSSGGVRLAGRFAATVATGFGLLFLLLPHQLLAVFGMDDPTAVALGVQLLRILSVSGIFIAVALAYTGGLQGTGDTRSPLFISIVSQVVIPLGICFTIQQFGTLHPIHVWIAILVGHFTRAALSVARFNQGRWRSITIE